MDGKKAEMKKFYIPELVLPGPPDTLIFLCFRGSIAHGTYIPSSDPNSIDDKDIIGCYIKPINHYIGFGGPQHKEKLHGCWDAVSYELRRLCELLLKSNPNVLSLLFMEKNMIIKSSDIWKQFLKQKELFISRQAYYSFSGYAKGQLHRMTHMQFEGYMGPKRRKIVERFGYDVKNASHLIRLLTQSIEYLNDGVLRVDRTNIDAEELIEIKTGKWSLDKVKEFSEHLFNDCKLAFKKSPLPLRADRKAVEDFLVKIIMDFHEFYR